MQPAYVHVRYQDFELGCGLYRNGHLDSQIPKILRSLPLHLDAPTTSQATTG
ncbi:hypothetical protein [Trichothermofontia sp.]